MFHTPLSRLRGEIYKYFKCQWIWAWIDNTLRRNRFIPCIFGKCWPVDFEGSLILLMDTLQVVPHETFAKWIFLLGNPSKKLFHLSVHVVSFVTNESICLREVFFIWLDASLVKAHLAREYSSRKNVPWPESWCYPGYVWCPDLIV